MRPLHSIRLIRSSGVPQPAQVKPPVPPNDRQRKPEGPYRSASALTRDRQEETFLNKRKPRGRRWTMLKKSR